MSVGLFSHPTLGKTKKYILNNKYVLEIKLDLKLTDDWNRQYLFFKETFLKDKQIKFYFLPEEIYVEREETYEEEYSKAQPIRIAIYDHFVLTLKEELQIRIKLQAKFSKSELCCGALEMISIYENNPSGDGLEINPQTILLNEYGYVKLLGYFSSPFGLKSRVSYRAPQSHLTPQTLPQKNEVCCSVALGRIIASLIMLKDMDEFFDSKQRIFNDIKLLEELKKYEDEIGLLFNLLKLMLTQNLNDRLLVSEIKALLLPYEDQILALKDFTLDRQKSRQSMLEFFVND